MGQIGSLNGGAGVPTVFAGQAQLEGYLVIGGPGLPPPITGLSVEVDGVPFININGQDLIIAFSQWLMQFNGSTVEVAFMLKLATGKVQKNTTIRLVNAGALTPDVFAFSDNGNGVPFQATTKTINAQSYESFDKFSCLFLDVSAGTFDNMEIVFADGSKATLTPNEVNALNAFKMASDTDGRLATGNVTVLDNTDASIREVRINTDATPLTVLVAKIPQAAFEVLKKQLG